MTTLTLPPGRAAAKLAVPKAARRKQTVILLGPQFRKETLASELKAHKLDGRIATVTAGWQEREDEIQALQAHLDGRSENLRLHARADQVFAEHPDLEEAHRARQTRLHDLQHLYNVRVEHAMAAVAELARHTAGGLLVEEQWRAAVATVTAIDSEHEANIRRIHDEFEGRLNFGDRAAVKRHRREITKILKGCCALAIAGGHVAVLLNRLRLFDIVKLVKDKPVVAWSAGAMALSERVVLYHDSPPQGPGNPEVLEIGLGLVRGIVALPHAGSRLRLDDPNRVSRLALRFAPSRCLAMDDGARLTVGPDGWFASARTRQLNVDGTVGRVGG